MAVRCTRPQVYYDAIGCDVKNQQISVIHIHFGRAYVKGRTGVLYARNFTKTPKIR